VALQPSTITPRDGGVANQTVSPPGESSTDDVDVSNLLVPEQPSYMSDYSGRLRYLGHSSTWSFSYQVLQMASQGTGLSCSPAASMQRHVDGETYSIDSQHRVDLSAIETTGLPSLELALYYLQSTKFRTYPFFHLFEETDFMHDLHLFYRESPGICQNAQLMVRALSTHHGIRKIFYEAASNRWTRRLGPLHACNGTDARCHISLS
jgi:hypothetical protein